MQEKYMKMRDIANAAGVSLTAVSLVLNNKPGVGPEKRRIITKLLQENGYQICSSSSNDETKSRIIHFLKYGRHNYLVNGNPGFVTQIIDSVDQECRLHGFDLLITTFNDFNAININELLQKPATKGIILLGTEIQNADMRFFSACEKPLVVVDNSLFLLPFNSVTMHNEEAIYSAVEHLVALGHHHIGFLANSIPTNNDAERLTAYKNALLAFNFPIESQLVFPLFPTMDGARKSMTQILKKETKLPSALIANNDSIAIGALRALKEFDLQVPEDISLVGFDGLPFAAVSDPPLTTVTVPCSEIGHWAMQILLEKIHTYNKAVCKIRVCTQFTKRESTTFYHVPRRHPLLLPE